MNRRFANARSPLRLLEKGLHGGLGIGNIGVVVAGHGVGKTPFLVGVALDELLNRWPEWDIDRDTARLAPTSTMRGWEYLRILVG